MKVQYLDRNFILFQRIKKDINLEVDFHLLKDTGFSSTIVKFNGGFLIVDYNGSPSSWLFGKYGIGFFSSEGETVASSIRFKTYKGLIEFIIEFKNNLKELTEQKETFDNLLEKKEALND